MTTFYVLQSRQCQNVNTACNYLAGFGCASKWLLEVSLKTTNSKATLPKGGSDAVAAGEGIVDTAYGCYI